jgi:hypothetical protein
MLLGYQWQVTGSGYTNVQIAALVLMLKTATLTITNPTVSMTSYGYRAVLTE